MNEILNEYILPHFGAFLSALLTGFAGFIFGKRRQNAETDAVEIENTAKLTDIYQKTLDDLSSRYEAKFREITGLYEDKIKLLQDEISILKRSIKQLKEENERLRKRLKENNLELN